MIEATSNPLSLSPVFDRVALEQRCMGNAALVVKLIAMLMGSLPNERTSLQTAVESGDLINTARLAHKLRGAASNVGAIRLALSSKELEHSARSASQEDVQVRWREVASQIDQLLDCLSSTTAEGST